MPSAIPFNKQNSLPLSSLYSLFVLAGRLAGLQQLARSLSLPPSDAGGNRPSCVHRHGRLAHQQRLSGAICGAFRHDESHETRSAAAHCVLRAGARERAAANGGVWGHVPSILQLHGATPGSKPVPGAKSTSRRMAGATTCTALRVIATSVGTRASSCAQGHRNRILRTQ